MKILHISANPKPVKEANSKQITEEFFRVIEEKGSDIEITHVDLFESRPPFYDFNTYKFFYYPILKEGYVPTEEEKKAVEYSMEQVKLFNDADVLVITSPMWNFSVPGILKAWEDMVLVPGHTFVAGADGVKPLHRIKKLILLLGSWGAYEGDKSHLDALTPQIKAAFGYVGIKDIEIAWADGQYPFFDLGRDERKAKAMEKARELAEKVVEMNKVSV